MSRSLRYTPVQNQTCDKNILTFSSKCRIVFKVVSKLFSAVSCNEQQPSVGLFVCRKLSLRQGQQLLKSLKHISRHI